MVVFRLKLGAMRTGELSAREVKRFFSNLQSAEEFWGYYAICEIHDLRNYYPGIV
jgi:hypothetical protein